MKTDRMTERDITLLPYRVTEQFEHSLENKTFKGMYFQNTHLNVQVLDWQNIINTAAASAEKITEINITASKEKNDEAVRNTFNYFCEAYEPIAAYISYDSTYRLIKIITIK